MTNHNKIPFTNIAQAAVDAASKESAPEFKVAKIDICRTSCSRDEDHITMRIMGTDTRTWVELKMGLKEFAESITGLGCRPCKVKRYREAK